MKEDIHVHSQYSADSRAPMEDIVRKAIERHIDVLCFTDHIDWDYPVEELTFDFNIPEYLAEITALQNEYKGKIRILKGVELGLMPQLGPRYAKLLKDYPFDFAIGSQHLVGNMDPYYPETFAGKSDSEVYRQYFEDTLVNVRAFHEFDSMGHLDYVVRYGREKPSRYSYRAFADIIDEILKELVKENIALEVNTCGFRKQLGAPNPCPEIIRRYRELGGTLVTIGSDAHKPACLGYDFELATDILRSCGYTHFCWFEHHTPRFERL